MSGGNSRFLFTTYPRESYHRSSSESRRNVPTVLKVHHKFSVLVRNRRDNKIGNHSIVLANGDIDTLGYLQSILRYLPLTMRDAGVNTGKYSGSQRSKESKPLEHRLPPWHLVMAAFAGLLGGGWGWWNLTLEERENLALGQKVIPELKPRAKIIMLENDKAALFTCE